MLYESTLKFVASLYSNNNFNNSDVCRVQSEMSEHILKPLVSYVKNIAKINTSKPILVSAFNKT